MASKRSKNRSRVRGMLPSQNGAMRPSIYEDFRGAERPSWPDALAVVTLAPMHWEYVLLCFSAALAGAVNSVAGGGTLLTFPVLLALLSHRTDFADRASVVANQTSTMALIPGICAAAWGYRRQ